ncbi:unnamed protein product [Cochlearia groenlandica]
MPGKQNTERRECPSAEENGSGSEIRFQSNRATRRYRLCSRASLTRPVTCTDAWSSSANGKFSNGSIASRSFPLSLLW